MIVLNLIRFYISAADLSDSFLSAQTATLIRSDDYISCKTLKVFSFSQWL